MSLVQRKPMRSTRPTIPDSSTRSQTYMVLERIRVTPVTTSWLNACSPKLSANPATAALFVAGCAVALLVEALLVDASWVDAPLVDVTLVPAMVKLLIRPTYGFPPTRQRGNTGRLRAGTPRCGVTGAFSEQNREQP